MKAESISKNPLLAEKRNSELKKKKDLSHLKSVESYAEKNNHNLEKSNNHDNNQNQSNTDKKSRLLFIRRTKGDKKKSEI